MDCVAQYTACVQPLGPYDLADQSQYFGGWPTLEQHPQTLVLAFPVEGWQGSAAVAVSQASDGAVQLVAHGDAPADQAVAQALAVLSLDVDATGWPDVGGRDQVLGDLQRRYRFVRPVLFPTPYEAAAHFVLGHRRSTAQARRLRTALADSHGDPVNIGGQVFHAFPRPQVLAKVAAFPGVEAPRLERLRAIAAAALDGTLDRGRLRALEEEEALAELRQLPGIGDFFAQGILHRGAGSTDAITRDELSLHAIRTAYDLSDATPPAQVLEIGERWRPFRMWATVLLHIDMRRSGALPAQKRPSGPTRFR